MRDKMMEEADWKDGINAFRGKISKEITEIYQSIARIESQILKLIKIIKLTKKENTP